MRLICDLSGIGALRDGVAPGALAARASFVLAALLLVVATWFVASSGRLDVRVSKRLAAASTGSIGVLALSALWSSGVQRYLQLHPESAAVLTGTLVLTASVYVIDAVLRLERGEGAGGPPHPHAREQWSGPAAAGGVAARDPLGRRGRGRDPDAPSSPAAAGT